VWVKRILQEKFSGVRQKSIAAMFGPRLAKPFSPSVAAAARPHREGLDAPVTKLLLGSGSGTAQSDDHGGECALAALRLCSLICINIIIVYCCCDDQMPRNAPTQMQVPMISCQQQYYLLL
jgi:hypothetical protein